MSHQTTIDRLIREEKSNISAATIRTYTSAINSICRKADVSPTREDFAEKHKHIINHINIMDKPSSRRTYFSACMTFLKPTSDTEAKLAYEKEFQKMKTTIRQIEEKQEPTPQFQALRESSFTWETVIKYRELYEKEYSNDMFEDKARGQGLLWKIQQYVALCCYTMIEPRRSQDYCEFVLRNPDPEKENYMMERDGKHYFVFNCYKTAKSYGKQQIEIPDKLATIINRWALISGSRHLFMLHRRTQPMSQPAVCHMFYDIFNNQKVSVNLLRHLYLAQFVDQDTKMKEIAKNMGHSVGMQHMYIYHDLKKDITPSSPPIPEVSM